MRNNEMTTIPGLTARKNLIQRLLRKPSSSITQTRPATIWSAILNLTKDWIHLSRPSSGSAYMVLGEPILGAYLSVWGLLGTLLYFHVIIWGRHESCFFLSSFASAGRPLDNTLYVRLQDFPSSKLQLVSFKDVSSGTTYRRL